MNILIPAAGAGYRFRSAGYTLPKPLIDVAGKPMIERVLENVRPRHEHRVAVVVSREISSSIIRWPVPGIEWVVLDHATDGAARTAVWAIHQTQMDLDDPLLIANSDQLLDWSVDDFLVHTDGRDGGIVVFGCPERDPRWSYAQVRTHRERSRVVRVIEKQAISDFATVGIYWWDRTSDFLRSATDMICRDERTNGEFYVAPTYNDLIREGKDIFPYFVRREAMHGLGTPEDLMTYLESQKEAA